MKTYLVGGAVRDQLLGREVKERDWVVVGASPEDMLAQGYRQVGKDFPVFLHPETGEEYALARTERKTGHGYTGFDCYAAPDVTLEDDLKRRDLTINAMAQDAQGNIIDPYNGQADLQQKILRHISPAFAEDPLRILRIARFQARYHYLGFTVAEETNQLMQTMVAAGEVEFLVAERVWQELHKALGEQHPSQFFQALRNCNALAIILPEVDALFGVPQPEKWHPEIDTGVHVLMVIDQAVRLKANNKTRFAALMHDLGKGVTPQNLWPKHLGHEEKGVPLVEAVCQRLRAPKDYKELAIIATRYHTHVHKAEELKASTIVKVLEHVDAFRRPGRFEEFLLACQADSQGRTGHEDSAYPQAALFRQAYQAASQVDVQTVLDQGVTGAAISEKLHQLRVTAVKRLHSAD